MYIFKGDEYFETLQWDHDRYDRNEADAGVEIKFTLIGNLDQNRALNHLQKNLGLWGCNWLTFRHGSWIVDLSLFKAEFGEQLEAMRDEAEALKSVPHYMGFIAPSNLTAAELSGTLKVVPAVDHFITAGTVKHTTISFIIIDEQLMENKPKRIFLSHKSEDKPLVRGYRNMLRTLGFDPWMDEHDLRAGDKLHRGIAQGFQDSCAAIFFLTENYVDERYLATEIDYAMQQHYEKNDRFRIITLVFAKTATVPQLLQQFVYKFPKTDFEALSEIIKALPIGLGDPFWK